MRTLRNVFLLSDGETPPIKKMHVSDLVLKFSGPDDEKLFILKSRYSHEGHYFSLKQTMECTAKVKETPVPMLLWCPNCGERHIDKGEFATKAHHTHACQDCGVVWRPAIVPTVGVQFLPGFKDGEK